MSEIILYQPSNGTEFDMFVSRYCRHCSKMPLDRDAKTQCGIMGRMLIYNSGDKSYPKQLQWIDDNPTCTAFVSREEANELQRKNRMKLRTSKDSKTLDLF